MSKPSKIVLGIVSVFPLLYFFVFMASLFGMFLFFADAGPTPSSGPPRAFVIFMIAHLTFMLLSFALTAFYIVYLFRTDRVEQGKKALWAVVLFLGNMAAFPVFWYLYVWREPPREAAA